MIVDNEYIKKTEILPQPEDDPPLAMVAAVKTIEIYMVLEQVRCGSCYQTSSLSHDLGVVYNQCPNQDTCRRLFSNEYSH